MSGSVPGSAQSRLRPCATQDGSTPVGSASRSAATCVAAFRPTTGVRSSFWGGGAYRLSHCDWGCDQLDRWRATSNGARAGDSRPVYLRFVAFRRSHGRFSHWLVASCAKVVSLRDVTRSTFRVNRPATIRQPCAQQCCACTAVPVRSGVDFRWRRPTPVARGRFRGRSPGSCDHAHGSCLVDAGRGEKARRPQWRWFSSCSAYPEHACETHRAAAVCAASHRVVGCRSAATLGRFRSTSSPSRCSQRARLIHR